jgi:23S rRNA (cytidine1920-2'-O)/16S rRNA (cytidine1409-2'-O)-methyltransferase
MDVGKGILHWRLRNDPRVVVMEQTNARFVAALPETIALATIDASFISLRVLLPVVQGWLPKGEDADTGSIVMLIKPQFEAGKRDVSRGKGVIRDAQVHRRVLTDVLSFCEAEGLGIRGLSKSPLFGPKGNTEFLAWVKRGASTAPIEELIQGVAGA